MNKFVQFFGVVFVLSVVSTPNLLQAQRWPKEKEEIWGVVQDLWAHWSKGDLSYTADEFRGWNTNWHATYDKAQIQPWIKNFHEQNDVLLYDLNPLAIELHDDIVIAFYTYQMLVQNKDGSQREESGRWTDIYKKISGEWKLVAEAGYVNPTQ